MTASASGNAPASRRATSARSSRAIPSETGIAPALATSARRPGPFASGMPAGPRGVRRFADLVAGGEDGDPRAAMDGHGGDTRARRERDGAGTEPRPRRQHLATSAQVVPPASDRAADSHRDVHRAGRGQGSRGVAAARPGRSAGRIERGRLLDRHDRVRAARQGRPRRDAERVPRLHPSPGDLAGPGLADDAEHDRPVLARADRVGGPDRIAIHRAVVPGRQVRRRDDGRRQPAAERGLRRCLLGRERVGDRGQDGGERLLDREQARGRIHGHVA